MAVLAHPGMPGMKHESLYQISIYYQVLKDVVRSDMLLYCL